jgi:undecaprenyl-diphosphatase
MTTQRRASLLWLAAVLGALALAGLTADLLHGGWVLSVDRTVERHVLMHQRQSLNDIARVLSWLGEPVTVVVVVVLATVALVVRRDLVRAVALPVGAAGALVLGQLVRHAVGRSAPTDGSHLHVPGGMGYPSGHALGAALCMGAIAIAVRRKRVGVATAVLAGLAAIARVYDFAHFPSDVVAGLLTAGTMLLVVEALAETVSTRRRGG